VRSASACGAVARDRVGVGHVQGPPPRIDRPHAVAPQSAVADHRAIPRESLHPLILLAALTLATLLAACCHPAPRLVPVAPPPCLGELPPDPPASEDDAAWSGYHSRLEAWAAYVTAACGAHLLEEP